ncbi:repressor LexA [Candidatus Woesebacteria bacterium RIFCSPHIGHO2_02_FULL_38_9]|uniref:Repressor LexA n=1 Tax=Candidatus Woesebacteria bacterium RIFCSPHIGHO2_01_FULL_39_28 TaxID=1802496 RepID=A0A1F7YJ87_9BACT|nr:MAG: repressor LexA [Candidatus Woesebacteria bacterium RIFCSPHIGHO2_01_FULL_39_28]OGM31754.1 MAG: repressor LexA [Candidatus Woesebacteria bacterium RIFCSPHIGHO2_02_FULL_38_9]OGM57696.1 MAG: repressor LexA [Candidatus Woesebacteria bacterium RIFCSPLOWO2_01_FULL_38_20]
MIVKNQTPPTPKQKKALDFINAFRLKNGYSPSLNEIAHHFGKSISTAQHFVEELREKGQLLKEENVARGISSASEAVRQIFKLGYIAAGSPIEPIENPEPIDVPISLLKDLGNYYALEVKGDSMVEDSIEDGDTILVRHQQTANSGDRIVAITENGVTLKVLRFKSGKPYLEPRNKNLDNIYPKRLEIRGKFYGLIRKGE